jgi:hypothetical protein
MARGVSASGRFGGLAISYSSSNVWLVLV